MQRDDSGERVGDIRVPGDEPGAQTDGRLSHADRHHALLHHGLRHRHPRQPVRLPRHLPELAPPHRHELLPRVSGRGGPNDHHFR